MAVATGKNATGLSLRLAPASVLRIQVQDAQKALSQTTKDGRRPDLTLGVWGPGGLYHPAHASGSAPGRLQGTAGFVYRLAVPRDTVLSVYISSRDVRLGDAAGAPLPANAAQQPFQHTSGDPDPKSFSFSVLGVLP